MLTLPIKRKWFDMILSGEKLEEYRLRSKYWEKRFAPLLNEMGFKVRIRNGYSAKSPSAILTINAICIRNPLSIRLAAWGAPADCDYFVLFIAKAERE